MKSPALVLFSLVCTGLVWGAGPEFSPVSRLPLIHSFSGSFGSGRFLAKTNDELKALAASPPDVLWINPFANYNFRMGPISGLGGEEAVPQFKDTTRKRLSADEVAERSTMLRSLIEKLRGAGIRHVAPYTCFHTLVGEHERRLGFWEFYDHWDEYRQIGLYEKPKTDPFEWCQQNPDGSPRYLYSREHFQFWPPLYRYAASAAHPDRIRWMQFIVEDMASLGINGMFSDNSRGMSDFGPFARAAFAKWIEGRYSEAQIKQCFGGFPAMSEAPGTLAAFETRLAWCHLTREYFRALRKTGESLNPSFFLMPNGGGRDGSYVEFCFPDCDQVMAEVGPAVPGHGGSTQIVGPFQTVSVTDHIYWYTSVFGVGARARAFAFINAGSELLNRNTSFLMHGEAAAFGGGGSTCSPTAYACPKLIPVQQAYRAHYTKHRTLYEGKRTLPAAAVACFGTQWLYDNYDHNHRRKIIFDALLEQHVLTDVLTMPGCFKENLARYRLIVVPFLNYLSDEHVQAFEEFRQNGGELLVYGDSGKYDAFMRERKDNPLARLAVPGDFTSASLKAKLSECQAKVWPVIVPGGLPNDWEGNAVKAAGWMDDPVKPRQLILHIVNYNVSSGANTDRRVRVPTISVELPLPAGLQPRGAKIMRLDDDREEDVAVTVAGDRGRFTLTDVGIHTVCVVQ